MTVQISAESLSPLHHNQLPVITTELLASLYGTEVNGIQQNFKRNIARFVVGKHFFKLEGNELRDFKNRLTDSQSVAKHTRSLIRWKQNRPGKFSKSWKIVILASVQRGGVQLPMTVLPCVMPLIYWSARKA